VLLHGCKVCKAWICCASRSRWVAGNVGWCSSCDMQELLTSAGICRLYLHLYLFACWHSRVVMSPGTTEATCL
jgi:hypothetical protein